MKTQYTQIISTLNKLRAEIRWKPQSALRHLQKRRARGHLPPTATLSEYEAIIRVVLQDKSAEVYLYWYNQVAYVTVVGPIGNQKWLVMATDDGILESAFVVERPELYLKQPGFEYMGTIDEVMQ
ncbi:MAG TPA: hypothetical protein PKH77_15050 [Anaerolineae bacterium]|nr:hypothetical protein [Anaerolineae bacterium]